MSAENLAPQVISRLMGEIRDLVRRPAEGVEFVANEHDTVSEIHAFISGPEETPYFGGKFRLKLVISEEYPNVPPKGYFLTRIYHPNVATNGEICVNTLKRDWNSEVTIKHILQVIRCLLIIPFPESSLNEEAGKLFMESYDEFAARARLMSEVHSIPTTGGKAGACSVEDADADAKKKKVQDAKKKSMKRL
eukprot:gene8696-6253_t